MAIGPETAPTAPASAPSDLEGRIQEVLGTNNVTAERLRQLRDMLLRVDRGKLDRRDELLKRIQERMDALKQSVGAGSETAEQQGLRLELQGLQDRLTALEAPGIAERAGELAKGQAKKGKEFLGATVAGAPSVITNYFERGGEAFQRNKFEGIMSFAVPLLSILGIGVLARNALKKPKGKLAKVLVALLGMGGVVALANYAGRKAQAEQIDRQASRPVEGRVKELIDAITGGANVNVNDPRLVDVDLLQLNGAAITVGGHPVRLERKNNGGVPALRVAVGGNTFELSVIAATTVQSITRKRGMADIAVLLGVPTGHAYVTDEEFSKIVSTLAGSTVSTPVEVEYFTDSSKPGDKKKQKVNFTYVPPTAP